MRKSLSVSVRFASVSIGVAALCAGAVAVEAKPAYVGTWGLTKAQCKLPQDTLGAQIPDAMLHLLRDDAARARMATAAQSLGVSDAAERILAAAGMVTSLADIGPGCALPGSIHVAGWH